MIFAILLIKAISYKNYFIFSDPPGGKDKNSTMRQPSSVLFRSPPTPAHHPPPTPVHWLVVQEMALLFQRSGFNGDHKWKLEEE